MKERAYVPGLAKNGRRYAHPLEEEMAKILEREKISYEYSVFFRVKNGDGVREVDFVTKLFIWPKGCDRPIKHIEVKSRLSAAAKKQHDDLKEAGVDTFIVTRRDIESYQKHGFLDRRRRNGLQTD